jgi:hypothetical protein
MQKRKDSRNLSSQNGSPYKAFGQEKNEKKEGDKRKTEARESISAKNV